MHWVYIILSMVGGLAAAAFLCFWTVRWLGRRDPNSAVLLLRTRRKLTFFRLLLQDRRVPLYVKLLPLAAVVYVASPIDLLPGLIFDDVAVALLTLVLIVKFTPRHVLEELLRQADCSGLKPTG